MKFLERHAGWIQWGTAMLAVGALHFTDQRYVSKVTYDADQIAERKALVDMSTAIALLQANGKNLDDHEQRLRSLERTRTKAALNNYEIPVGGNFSVPDFRADN